jgi:hypothetical protein
MKTTILRDCDFVQFDGASLALHAYAWSKHTARRKKACTNHGASGFNIIKMLLYGGAGLKARYRRKIFQILLCIHRTGRKRGKHRAVC